MLNNYVRISQSANDHFLIRKANEVIRKEYRYLNKQYLLIREINCRR
jgi:hypothetical protein